MADGVRDVLQCLVAFDVEDGDDRAAAGVGGEVDGDASDLGGLLDHLGDGLA